MSQWLTHTSASQDDAFWQQAYTDATTWQDDTGALREVTERYRDERLEMLGYGAAGLVFKGQRKFATGYADVAVKMMLPNEASATTMAIRETRALIFLQNVAVSAHNKLCAPHLVCYVDHFVALPGARLFEIIADFIEPKRASQSSQSSTDDESVAKRVVANKFSSLVAGSENKPVHFIETHFVAGRSLRAMYREDGLPGGRMPFAKNLEMLLSAAQALQFMHAHELIHSDIKPDNIMVGHLYDGAPGHRGLTAMAMTSVAPECTLLDMGLACRVNAKKATVDEAIDDVGTCVTFPGAVGYYAPAQMRPQARSTLHKIAFATRASWDVYALGLSFRDYGLDINTENLRLLPLQSWEVTTMFVDAFDLGQPIAAVDESRSRVPIAPHFHESGDNADRALSRIIGSMLVLGDTRRATAADVVEDLLALKRSSSLHAPSPKKGVFSSLFEKRPRRPSGGGGGGGGDD
jgi:serine/threonine protein kinase